MQRQKKDPSLSTTAISAATGPEALFSRCPSRPTIPIHTNFCGLLGGLLADLHSLTPTKKHTDTRWLTGETVAMSQSEVAPVWLLTGLIVTAQMCDLVTSWETPTHVTAPLALLQLRVKNKHPAPWEGGGSRGLETYFAARNPQHCLLNSRRFAAPIQKALNQTTLLLRLPKLEQNLSEFPGLRVMQSLACTVYGDSWLTKIWR